MVSMILFSEAAKKLHRSYGISAPIAAGSVMYLTLICFPLKLGAPFVILIKTAILTSYLGEIAKVIKSGGGKIPIPIITQPNHGSALRLKIQALKNTTTRFLVILTGTGRMSWFSGTRKRTSYLSRRFQRIPRSPSFGRIPRFLRALPSPKG